MQQAGQLGNEVSIATSLEVFALERLDRRDQRLGHEAAAELAVVAAPIGIAPAEPIPGLRHRSSSIASSAALDVGAAHRVHEVSQREVALHAGALLDTEATSTPYGRTV